MARPHDHLWSRRRFLGAAAAAAGIAAGADLLQPLAALAGDPAGVPRPIPGGIQPFGPGTPIFHVFVPPNTEVATFNEMSTITDFKGFIGVCHVSGSGVGITGEGAPQALTYDVDNRFMMGEFVGTDGRHHHGAFGFV